MLSKICPSEKKKINSVLSNSIVRQFNSFWFDLQMHTLAGLCLTFCHSRSKGLSAQELNNSFTSQVAATPSCEWDWGRTCVMGS